MINGACSSNFCIPFRADEREGRESTGTEDKRNENSVESLSLVHVTVHLSPFRLVSATRSSNSYDNLSGVGDSCDRELNFRRNFFNGVGHGGRNNKVCFV